MKSEDAEAKSSSGVRRIPQDVVLEFKNALPPMMYEDDEGGGGDGAGASSFRPSGGGSDRHVTSSSLPRDDDEDDGTLLQYVSMGGGPGGGGVGRRPLTSEILARATRRCALVRSVFKILSEVEVEDDGTGADEGPGGVSRFRRLAEVTMANGWLDHMMIGGINENATWCVRTRRYGTAATAAGGEDVPERVVCGAMSPLLERLGGNVDLNGPDVQLYVLEGLQGRGLVLAKKLADGVQASLLAPNARACKTATPLCPIAAFAMCNIAMIKNGSTVLDPFAGSCTTLLAASRVVAVASSAPSSPPPRILTVGIDVSLGDDKGGMSEDRIVADFNDRGVTPPVALIRGDCRSKSVRDEARAAIRRGWRGGGGGGDVVGGFDAIVTDPPYGIRESMTDRHRDDGGSDDDRCGGSSSNIPPLAELLSAMAADLRAGTPLLRRDGGRLVAFVPVHRRSSYVETEGDVMMMDGIITGDDMPTSEQISEAGLSLVAVRRQRLSSNLSRCLVVFESRF